MAERYQQPVPGTPHPPPPGNYPQFTQQPPYGSPAPVAPPAQRGVFRRMARGLLRGMFYASTRTGQALQPFRLLLAISLPLLALVALLTTALLWDRIVGPQPVFTRAESIMPAPAVENFLDGQRAFDGGKMWDSLSPDFQAKLATNGMSRESLRQQIQSQKASGRSYLKPMYVGGVPIKSGGAMFFYQISMQAQGNSASSPIIFTVDPDGKIIAVD